MESVILVAAVFCCKRCGYVGKQKQSLVRHLQRKHICDPLFANDPPEDLVRSLGTHTNCIHVCNHCKKQYSSRSNMNAHIKICKKNPDNNEVQTLLMGKIKALEEKLTTLPQFTINKMSQHNNIQIFNVQSFGKESMDHIKTDFLTKCVLNQGDGVRDLISKIHFDPECPENKNIRIKSKKQNLFEIFDKEWVQCDKNNTLDEMIRNGYKILFAHFLNNKETINDLKEREDSIATWFIDLCSKQGNEYYRLRRDLYVMILNNTVYILGKVD